LSRRCGDEEVLEACRQVLERHGEVSSLRMLHSLVLRRLSCSISKKRLLRLLALSGMAELRVLKRRGLSSGRCPVCGAELQEARGVDLYLRETRAGLKCGECGYRVSRAGMVPARYIFCLKR